MRFANPYSLFGWATGLVGGILIWLGGGPAVMQPLGALRTGAPWWAALTLRDAVLFGAGLANCIIGHLLIRSADRGRAAR